MDLVKDLYNEDYAEKYQVLASTNLGKAIYHTRWALIERYCPPAEQAVLDYGCGPGSFNAHGPDGYRKFNYDINPVCGFTQKVWKEEEYDGNSPVRGRLTEIDILTMWDSIEHNPNFYQEIKDINAPWLFISTPNLESVDKPIVHWKHYRPSEHIFYFDRHSIRVILEDLGYKIHEFNYDEGKLRDPQHPSAILTVVASK